MRVTSIKSNMLTSGLMTVVTFGSSLDVAAIQAELPYKMDFNEEMKTVGKSNVMAGIFGGIIS